MAKSKLEVVDLERIDINKPFPTKDPVIIDKNVIKKEIKLPIQSKK